MTRYFPISAALALAIGTILGAPPAIAQTAKTEHNVDWLLSTGPTRDRLGARSEDGGQISRRHAVVIGNGNYAAAEDLGNALADARAMTEFLRAKGFTVDSYLDLDKRGFERMLRRVLFEVGPDSEVLFYFAGHGIQMGRRNYLLPVDANLGAAYDTPFETVTLDSIVEIIGARSRLQLVVLDSCRNNPFTDAMMMTEIDSTLFETRDGFSPMSAPVNSLVAYSTSPGAVAFDGLEENSPFTDALLEVASAAPDQSLRTLLDEVRREVYARTDGRQVPWESSTLIEPYYFLRPESAPLSPVERYGRNRGLSMIVAEVAEVSDPAIASDVSPVVPDEVRIEAPLDRRIAIGAALLEALSPGDGVEIALGTEVAEGRLVIEAEGVPLRDYLGGPLTTAALGDLVFEYTPEQRPGTADPAELAVSVTFPVTGTAGLPESVTLDMTPAACDIEAGDWLDPEGVGLTRYPNEIDPDSAAAACVDAIASEPETGRFHYQLGRALQARTDYDGARAAFEDARDLGHTRAWHALGDLVAEADSIERGGAAGAAPQEALALYATGVERGDPYAYHALGKQLLRHGKTDAAQRYGFELLSQAIELGHTFAMNELGYYFLAEGTEHFEPERGLRYLTESAGRNDIYGYNNLGLVYDRGLGGIEADAEKALTWYAKASEGGHPFAPVNIGRMYYGGRLGGAPNIDEAIAWYDQGLARGTAWGGANAAWIIANDKPAGFAPSDAAVRAAKAAVLRDEEAARQAFSILSAMDRQTLDTAIQQMIKEFNPDQVVDGQVGPMTRAAIADLATEYGVENPPAETAAQILAMAQIFWKATGIRIDLL